MNDDLALVIEQLEGALGPAVATPEWLMTADYRETGALQYAAYRVWRWDCPVCRAGLNDVYGIYRPLAVDSDGHISCDACGCAVEEIADAVVSLSASGSGISTALRKRRPK